MKRKNVILIGTVICSVFALSLSFDYVEGLRKRGGVVKISKGAASVSANADLAKTVVAQSKNLGHVGNVASISRISTTPVFNGNKNKNSMPQLDLNNKEMRQLYNDINNRLSSLGDDYVVDSNVDENNFKKFFNVLSQENCMEMKTGDVRKTVMGYLSSNEWLGNGIGELVSSGFLKSNPIFDLDSNKALEFKNIIIEKVKVFCDNDSNGYELSVDDTGTSVIDSKDFGKLANTFGIDYKNKRVSEVAKAVNAVEVGSVVGALEQQLRVIKKKPSQNEQIVIDAVKKMNEVGQNYGKDWLKVYVPVSIDAHVVDVCKGLTAAAFSDLEEALGTDSNGDFSNPNVLFGYFVNTAKVLKNDDDTRKAFLSLFDDPSNSQVTVSLTDPKFVEEFKTKLDGLLSNNQDVKLLCQIDSKLFDNNNNGKFTMNSLTAKGDTFTKAGVDDTKVDAAGLPNKVAEVFNKLAYNDPQGNNNLSAEEVVKNLHDCGLVELVKYDSNKPEHIAYINTIVNKVWSNKNTNDGVEELASADGKVVLHPYNSNDWDKVQNNAVTVVVNKDLMVDNANLVDASSKITARALYDNLKGNPTVFGNALVLDNELVKNASANKLKVVIEGVIKSDEQNNFYVVSADFRGNGNDRTLDEGKLVSALSNGNALKNAVVDAFNGAQKSGIKNADVDGEVDTIIGNLNLNADRLVDLGVLEAVKFSAADHMVKVLTHIQRIENLEQDLKRLAFGDNHELVDGVSLDGISNLAGLDDGSNVKMAFKAVVPSIANADMTLKEVLSGGMFNANALYSALKALPQGSTIFKEMQKYVAADDPNNATYDVLVAGGALNGFIIAAVRKAPSVNREFNVDADNQAVFVWNEVESDDANAKNLLENDVLKPFVKHAMSGKHIKKLATDTDAIDALLRSDLFKDKAVVQPNGNNNNVPVGDQ